MATRPLAGRSERELIRAAQGGSEEAIDQIYRAHWPMAHRTAYLVVHDAAAAEDIAQEAFIAALRALGRFDRRRPFGPWLHRIVVNRSIDWGRRRAARAEVAMKPLEDEAAGAEQLDDGVLSALRELPPDQRAIVVLRHLLEYTPGEIARMLDLPRGTVNSRLRRGLDRVRASLEEAADE
jgi:RNA polymerase sigma-70 factor (ECF subfamily)